MQCAWPLADLISHELEAVWEREAWKGPRAEQDGWGCVDESIKPWCHRGATEVSSLCVLSPSVLSYSFMTSWTIAHQVPQSLESSRQEYWSG